MTTDYGISFRFYFNSESETHFTTHYQPMPLSDIPRWIEAYKFTHPNCTAVSVKVWFNDCQSG